MPYSQDVLFRPGVDRKDDSFSRIGELGLIRHIRERAGTGSGVRLGIGDDCALLRVGPTEEIAVTTDLSIAGRHFRLDWHPPEVIGHRALARGLSDLAAMGARPIAAFLSLALPSELVRKRAGRRPFLDRFFDGLLNLAKASGTSLAGGDLAESPVFTADIVLLGAVRRGSALLRSGARAGHILYVTGTLGGAAASLKKLAARRSEHRNSSALHIPKRLAEQLAPHLAPQPRLVQGQLLARRRLASSAIDISDGLSTDLAHICEESGVAAEIDATSLPIHPGATLEQALHGGEDYELLFTAPRTARIPRSIAGVPITRIGRMQRAKTKGEPITLLTPTGAQALRARGWEHFS